MCRIRNVCGEKRLLGANFGLFCGEFYYFCSPKDVKMTSDILYMLLFSANLVFIVTNIYGWLLKRFFVPEAYRHNFHELYPAQHSVANFYLLQLIEVPYLLMVGRPEALFYANGTSLLVFSSYILVMVKGYFFLKTPSPKQLLAFLLPVWACWLAMLLPLFGVVAFTPVFKWTMTGIILALFVIYMFLLDRFRLQVMRHIRELDEDEYSNEDDFPVKFARSIKWLPLILCVILSINFLINDPIVKMLRDIVFTVINVWFAIYTLNPHRKARHLPVELKQKMEQDEEKTTEVKHRLSEAQCQEMEYQLLHLIRDKQLYLDDHLSMNDLIHELHTNKTYLSEVIARSPYESFYKLVNTLRVEHAIQLLNDNPSLKLEQTALSSGFASGSAFSQVFKRIKGISPSEYLHEKA